jgi:hypothetical protein
MPESSDTATIRRNLVRQIKNLEKALKSIQVLQTASLEKFPSMKTRSNYDVQIAEFKGELQKLQLQAAGLDGQLKEAAARRQRAIDALLKGQQAAPASTAAPAAASAAAPAAAPAAAAPAVATAPAAAAAAAAAPAAAAAAAAPAAAAIIPETDNDTEEDDAITTAAAVPDCSLKEGEEIHLSNAGITSYKTGQAKQLKVIQEEILKLEEKFNKQLEEVKRLERGQPLVSFSQGTLQMRGGAIDPELAQTLKEIKDEIIRVQNRIAECCKGGKSTQKDALKAEYERQLAELQERLHSLEYGDNLNIFNDQYFTGNVYKEGTSPLPTDG